LKDIKTTARNGSVIGICRVRDEDEVMMITAQGQIQRIAVSDVRVTGRNTQGVRLINLDEGDTLVAVKRIPKIESETADGGRGANVMKAGSAATRSDRMGYLK
jgi:DNA gyrase subunit A